MKIKRFFYSLFHPKEWGWVIRIKHRRLKLKDYDRMEYDYSCVLCHATDSKMSKTNYLLKDIYSQIDDAQAKIHYDIVKSDIEDILKQKGLTDYGRVDEIKKYLKELI